MGILDIASANSIWRGYDYFENNRVISFHSISETILKAQYKEMLRNRIE